MRRQRHIAQTSFMFSLHMRLNETNGRTREGASTMTVELAYGLSGVVLAIIGVAPFASTWFAMPVLSVAPAN